MGPIVMAGDPGLWDVAWNWPVPFVTAVAVLAVPMAGIIWLICQLKYKQQIATLKDRVELVDERLGDANEKIGALIVLPSIFVTTHRSSIVALAARYRFPAIYPFRFFVVDGGLLAYGVDVNDQFWRVAVYADRILKGAKPADLPVQGPTKFELVINVKTAKALGVTVPDTLLALADEVIE